MGEVKVTVELENTVDAIMARRQRLDPGQVRRCFMGVLVDTGAVMMMLPQDLVETLGLEQDGKVIVTYADERREERPLAGPITVKVGNRATTVTCVVGPPNSEPLLGQIVLEALDLLVDSGRQQLVPRPESPFLPLLKMK
jgi:predicted aspartyl protease